MDGVKKMGRYIELYYADDIMHMSTVDRKESLICVGRNSFQRHTSDIYLLCQVIQLIEH